MATRQSAYGPIATVSALLIGGYVLHRKGILQKIFSAAPAMTQGTADIKLGLKGFDVHSDKSMSANIDLINPTSIPFRIQSIVGNLSIGGKPVGTIRAFGDTVLRANDQTLLPVNVKVENMKPWKRGALVLFAGKINVNNRLLNLQMRYTL